MLMHHQQAAYGGGIMSGLFIAFEGGEGAGKSTQAGLLENTLAARGYRSVLLREPGSTGLGEYLRKYLIAGAPLTPAAELLLFEAARAQLMAEKITGALDAGAIVIADRFAGSTVAYQGYGNGLDRQKIEWLNDFATGRRYPDLTILLDIDPYIGLGRAQGRQLRLGLLADNDGNRFEGRELAYHQAVRCGFLDLAAALPDRWRIVESNRSIEDVAVQVWNAVAPLLPP